MSNELAILIGMANQADVRVVSRLLEQHGLSYRVSRDSGTLGAEAAGGCGALLLEEEILTAAVVEDIEGLLLNAPLWSELPVVLLVRKTPGRRSRGKSLLDRIPNLTIIERPISSASLISVLRSVLEARQRQYQVRDLLGDLRRSNRELEKRLRQSAVTQFTDIMLVYLDPDFNFVWVNPPYAANTGMEPEELVGKNHFDLFPDPENEAIFKKVRDSGKPVFYKDKPFVFPDHPEWGVTYWDWSLSPEIDAEGEVEGLVLSLRETTQYKEAQLALEESEARFRSIAEISSDIIFRVDPKGVVTYISPAVRSFGYEPEKLLNHHFSKFVAGEDLPGARAALAQVVDGDRLSLIEMKLLRADRSEVEIEVSASPVFRGKRVVEVQGVARDISERRRAEEKLRESREWLELAVDATGFGAFDFYPQTGRLIWSEHSRRHFGLGPEAEVNYDVFRKGLHPEDRERMDRIVKEVLRPENGGAYQAEYRTIGIEDGRERWISAIGRISFDEEGRPVRFVGGSTDITQHKRAEEEIERSRKRLQEILAGITDAYISLDSDWRLLEVNPVAANLVFKRSAAELSGKVFWDLYPEGRGKEFHRQYEKALASGEPVHFEGRSNIVDGWLEVHAYPFGDRLDIYFRDITERKRMEEDLRTSHGELERKVKERTRELEITHQKLLHAEKLGAVGKFSASIAHEINNPLFGIRNVIVGLRQSCLDGENAELVEMAIGECDRIKNLIRDLQDFNRPSTGVMASLDLHALIDSVVLLTKKEFENKNIRLETRYDDKIVDIVGIGDQLKQVVLNLLNNAADAIGKAGGVIAVSTELLGGEVSIEVRDSGGGVDPEIGEKLFEPFFSTKPAVKGTGLGLSVCYGIVTRHGGRINFTSAPDHGTTFRVILPIEGPPNER